MTPANGISRRNFVRSAGLVLGFSFVADLDDVFAQQPAASGAPPAAAPEAAGPPLRRIDSWLKIAPDGGITVLTGKVEIGMGVNIALAQIVAEELDVPLSRVAVVMGDTSTTPDQGGVGSSNSVQSGGAALRNVAATARALLIAAASKQLDVPTDQLRVRDGIISTAADPSKSVTYGALAHSGQWPEDLVVSGAGFTLQVRGSGKPKDPRDYTIVGKPIPRTDIADKVYGRSMYVGDVRVPGMLHGRVIRPPSAGAHVRSVDDAAAKKLAGFAQTVVHGDFVGVIAEREWTAVKAANAVKVTWDETATPFPAADALYQHIRSVTPKATRETQKRGDVDAGLARATTRVTASYEYPFQSHATMGPGCAVADVRPNGVTTVWCGAQKPHTLIRAFAELLEVPLSKVRVIWMPDAGSYGRPGFDDVGADAIVLSQASGKPVRVQWMRSDLTAWGPKGPAAVFDLEGGVDANGAITAVRFTSRSFSGGEINFQPAAKSNLLAAQLMGIPNTSGFDEFADWAGGAAPYAIDNILATTHVVPPLHPTPSPLATTHLRDPNGPQTTFAVESFIDELAAAAHADPLEFRLKHQSDPRAKAVLQAAAEKYGWTPRATRTPASGDTVRGRGISLGLRGGTYVGTVAEVEVNRRTGAIRVPRVVVAHDCGLVINPLGLRRTLEANVVQTLSRTLKEEVRFDRSRVVSVDWATYPVAHMNDVPAQIEIVIVNRPEVPSTGAGEATTRTIAAAVANAVFDATAVRLRRVPLTAAAG